MRRSDTFGRGTQLLVVALLLTVGFTLFAGVSMADTTEEVSVEAAAGEVIHQPGEEVTVDIVASVPNDGDIGAHETEVSLSATDAVEIASIEPAGDPEFGGNGTVSPDGESASLEVAYGDNALEPNDDDEVVIATVTLETKAEGEAEVVPDVSAIGDGDGNSYDVTEMQMTPLLVDESVPDSNWETELTGPIAESEMVVGDDAVFAVSVDDESDDWEEYEYTLEAFETNDGTERWNVTNDDFTWIVGIDDQVVVSEETDDEYQLVGYDTATGEQKWSHESTDRFDYQETTVDTEDGVVYAVSDESFIILDTTTGEVQSDVLDYGPSGVAHGDDEIYAVSDDRIEAVTPTGETIWNETVESDEYSHIEKSSSGTLLAHDDSNVALYNATDGSVIATSEWDGSDDVITAALPVDDGALVTVSDWDEHTSELVHLSHDGTTETVAAFDGSQYDFYDGETGLYLTGDELIRLDETYEVDWMHDVPINSHTVLEMNDQLVGVVHVDDIFEGAFTFDSETGTPSPLYGTDEWITWTAADEDQVYLGLPSSITALEPPTTDMVTLSGTVSAANGADVAGDELELHTDHDNWIHTEIGADGSYSVSVEANTTQSVVYDSTPERNGIADLYQFEPVEIGADNTSANLTVPEGDLLNVNVTDEHGDPVENATVHVYDVRDGNGTGTGPQSTTEDGLFHHHSADEPGIEIAGDASVRVLPPEDDDRFVDETYHDHFTVNESMTKTVQLEETDSDLPPVTGDSPPQDLSDDGLYEDVTGSGSFTVADVQALFDNRDSDAVQDNAAAFNFSGNNDEEVTMSDVQALWEDLQG